MRALVARLESAWNEADATAFAAEFSRCGLRQRRASTLGRDSIARGHAAIWQTIYAGSTIQYSVSRLRQLAPGVLLAHLDARLRVPSGPLAGDIDALPSLVLVLAGGAWHIESFHNTPRRQA